MGKSIQEEDKQKQNQKQQENQEQKQKPVVNEPKKKIIKKFPFKKTKETNNEDGLKDWKPVKIQKNNDKLPAKAIVQQNIAESFLNSLPKPVNKATQKKSIFFDDDQPIKLRPKIFKNNVKPTPEQIKWDIEDQTFIKKQFIHKPNVEHTLQVDQAEQQEPVEEIIIKGRQKQKNPIKMKHIDLTKVINQGWKQKQQNNIKNQLWEGAQGLLDGHGNLSKLARQAQEKKNQIEQQLNKRSNEDRKTRSRYGW